MKNRDEMSWEERARAAEQAVEVLKAKVHALYARRSTSALTRQLERAHRRQEVLRQRRELTELRATELGRYTAALESEVRERTRAMRAILDNVTSGFLLVGPDLVVRPEYSASCHDLFATEKVAGAVLPDLLALESADERLELELDMAQVFDDNLPAATALDVLPHRFVLGTSVLKMDARIIRTEGRIEALLLTFNDITDLERAERDADTNLALLGILKDRTAFQTFLGDAQVIFAEAREALTVRDHTFVRRAVHTVKGNAAAFGLTELVTEIHALEGAPAIDRHGLDAVEATLRAFVEGHATVLEMAYGAPEEERYEVSEGTLEVLRRALRRGDRRAVERWTSRLVLKRADSALGPLRSYVEKLAERLGKRISFQIHGADTQVDVRLLRPVFRNLVHVLRNAVDHGIEPPHERAPKPQVGHVELRISAAATTWNLEIRDDGRGIDPDTVARLAVERGVIDCERLVRMSVTEKTALIFVDGFSTMPVASEVSGRGYGMSAMMGVVYDLGGTVRVDSVPGTGTVVSITIPKADEVAVSQRPDERPSLVPSA